MKIVETVAFDYMMWKDSQTTNKYLCLMFMYNIKYMTSLRVKGASRVTMHNFQMNIFISSKTNIIYKKCFCYTRRDG